MRGIFYTAITFLIVSSLIFYIFFISLTNVGRSNVITRELSAQRVYYAWRSVQDNFGDVLGVKVGKDGYIASFNDSLPADIDILSLFNALDVFIQNYYQDETLQMRFEDPDGNKVNLSAFMKDKPVIPIKPMNINYGWGDWGKTRLHIVVDTSNFSYIDKLDMYIKLKNVQFACNWNHQGSPGDCDYWTPDKHVESCDGVQYCLEFNLTYEDSNRVVVNFVYHYFDVSKQSVNNLNVKHGNESSFFIKTQVGALPTLLDIDLKDVEVDTFTKFYLTTTDFYISYAAKFNVTSDFAKRIDWL